MIELAGHKWAENTAVVVCDHVSAGSEVRTIQVDEDGLCFQCGRDDDNPELAQVHGLMCLIDRPGLHDLPFIPMNFVAHREVDGNWTIEQQPDED